MKNIFAESHSRQGEAPKCFDDAMGCAPPPPTNDPILFLIPTLRAMNAYSPLQSSYIMGSVRNATNCDLRSQASLRAPPLSVIQRCSHRRDGPKVTDRRADYEKLIRRIGFATRRGPKLLRRWGARPPTNDPTCIPVVIFNRTWPFMGMLHKNPCKAKHIRPFTHMTLSNPDLKQSRSAGMHDEEHNTHVWPAALLAS